MSSAVCFALFNTVVSVRAGPTVFAADAVLTLSARFKATDILFVINPILKLAAASLSCGAGLIFSIIQSDWTRAPFKKVGFAPFRHGIGRFEHVGAISNMVTGGTTFVATFRPDHIRRASKWTTKVV